MNFFVFLAEQWLLFSILAVLVSAFVFLEKRRAGAVLSHHEATRQLNGDSAVLLDVREPKEYALGHITNAINIPFAKLKERLVELEKHKEKTVIVADKMGQQSGASVKILTEAGYQAARLQGGMAEWSNQNLPVVKS